LKLFNERIPNPSMSTYRPYHTIMLVMHAIAGIYNDTDKH
jgi:hypothetical protein